MVSCTPHILVFVYPVHGRLIPAMVLASRLADAGATVSFFYPAHHESRFRDIKSRATSSGIRCIPLHAQDLASAPQNFCLDFTIMPSLVQEFEKYVESIDDNRPLSLISDEVCGQIAKSARSLGIPRYVLVPESASALAAALFAPALSRESRLPLQIARKETMDIPLLDMTVLTTEYLSPYLDLFPAWLRDIFVDGATEAQRADGILINTYTELEPSILTGLETNTCLNPNGVPVLAVGPLIPDAASATVDEEHREELDRIIKFLDAQAPHSVVFASFGTLIQQNETDSRETLTGLEQSEYPFIWKHSSDGEFQIETGKGLILRGWVPQLQILSHPSTGMFLTHCGWNSSLESTAFGVPIVGFPRFMDQHINCKLLAEQRKTGIKLEALESSQITSAIKEVMESGEIRKNARELKLAADRSPKTLDFFVDKLKNNTRLH